MTRQAKAPTMQDVAKDAKVSSATVSYVLGGRRDGDDRISPDTRRRVLDAVKRLGYVPNQAAQNLARQRTERVCLVLPRLNSPYYEALALDVQRAADERGYALFIAAAGTRSQEFQILNQLRHRFADGVIIEPRYMQAENLKPLVELGVAVIVDSDYIQGEGFDIIRTMRTEAAYKAMKHLLERGHRRIAFLGNFFEHRIYYGRFDSYKRALREYDIAIDQELIRNGSATRQESFQVITQLLQIDDPPTAVFSASDIGAISALWAAKHLGLRVPADLAVVGVGNTHEGHISHPPLTSIGPVSLDFSDMASLLFKRLESANEPTERVHRREWKMFIRGST